MSDQKSPVEYEETTTPADGAAWLWLGLVAIFSYLATSHIEPGTHPSPLASAAGLVMFGAALAACFATRLKTQVVWWLLSVVSIVGLIVFAALSTS